MPIERAANERVDRKNMAAVAGEDDDLSRINGVAVAGRKTQSIEPTPVTGIGLNRQRFVGMCMQRAGKRFPQGPIGKNNSAFWRYGLAQRHAL